MVLQSVAESVRLGHSLASAMEQHPALFPPLHRAVIAAGEGSGVLPEVLLEVSDIAQLDYELGSAMRDAAVYPAATVLFAVGVLLFMLRFVVSHFPGMFVGLSGGSSLPTYTRVLGRFGGLSGSTWLVAALVYVIAVCLFMLLFTGPRSCLPLIRQLFRYFPGIAGIRLHLDVARLCGVWAVLVKREFTLDADLAMAELLVHSAHLRRGLDAIRRDHAAGISLGDCFARHPILPDPVCAAWQRASIRDLPAEFGELRRLYLERARRRARGVAVLWESLAVLVMALVVAAVIACLFLPLIELNQSLIGLEAP